MDHLHLKWGTIKSFDFSNSPHALSAYEEYVEIGQCMSAMLQEDTPRQKELICKMIDSVNGDIILSWTGENCANDREKAKKYVMEYGKDSVNIDTKNPRKSVFEVLQSFSKFLKP